MNSRVLIIVQNLPVPFDRRVWLECQSLTAAGYQVSVVCPRGSGTEANQVIDGVQIRAYPPYAPGGGAIGFVLEYAWSFVATAWLVLGLRRRGGPFAVLQACNPPDIFWPLARWLRWRDGTRFVFDHHDLCPELYRSRFGQGGPALRGLLALEKATFHTADRVTTTNGSYAKVATTRGHKPADQVTVVRTGPDPDKLRPGPTHPELRRGRRYLAAYVGVMGPQDGVDVIIDAADQIINVWGRDDVHFIVMGGGDCHADLVAQRDARGLGDFVELPGRVSDAYLATVLSTADVGLSPDPLNPLNDLSTMNKTMEYMAFGLPVLAFDLIETRVSAQDAAVYIDPSSADPVQAYAVGLLALLDDEAARARMGAAGRRRVEDELAWSHQSPGYVAVFDDLVGRVPKRSMSH